MPTTCPYPEPDQFNPCSYIPYPEDPSEYYPPIYAWVSQVVSFPQVSPPKPCIHLSPVRATCPTHLILIDFITLTLLGEEYRSVNLSLCGFLRFLLPHPPSAQIFSSAPYSQTPQPTFLPQHEKVLLWFNFIQGIHKRMVRFQKLRRNLFLTLTDGHNIHRQQQQLSKFLMRYQQFTSHA